MERYAIAVDVGGTSVKLGLFSAEETLCHKWEIPTHTEEEGSRILPEIVQSIRETLAERSIAPVQVLGIGMCVPGAVQAGGTVNRCVNLGWGVFSLPERMRELLPEIPHVVAGNDANVAALGELWKGGGAGFSSAVLFTLGTGVGGGVVLEGSIRTGVNGGAGEVGHMTVEPRETVACSCGKYGCLEQYASARGIVRMGREMLRRSETPSPLRELPAFTAKEICDLARAGDAMALTILDRCGEYLGRAMSYCACTIDPAVFLIGGGMSRAGAIVVDSVQKHYRRYAFHPSVDTPIVLAKLGNDAGIYGCARLVLDDIK